MKTRNAILLLALLAASCTTKNQNSSLVITKVLAGKASGVGAATTCSVNAGDSETDFLTYNPAVNAGHISAVVDNRLLDPTPFNTVLRTNTTDFLPPPMVVDYAL